MTPDQLTAMLHEVIDLWPDYVDSRHKGTPRVLTNALSPTTGRHDDGMRGYGSTPAPLHLDVLDVISTVVASADTLAEHIAHTLGHEPPPAAASAYADPRPHLAHCAHHLAAACQADPDMADAARARIIPMHTRVLGGLGLLVDGQLIDAICPFCIGRTYERPAGVRTLRVRVIPSRHVRAELGEVEPVVVCENPAGCTVLASEVGMWVRDRPAWPMAEWEWLAARLITTRRAS